MCSAPAVHPQFRFVGLGLSPANIQCASFAQSPRGNCTWMVGSALDLPFADNSVDAIINCESSHCYPDFARFVAEAERVLKPGGYFAIADLRWVEKCWSYRTFNPEAPLLHQMKAALNASGLHTVAEWDITPNVVESRELCTASEVNEIPHSTMISVVELVHVRARCRSRRNFHRLQALVDGGKRVEEGLRSLLHFPHALRSKEPHLYSRRAIGRGLQRHRVHEILDLRKQGARAL